MQTAHRIVIIHRSWNQVLEWTSESVQDSYSLNDFKRNFRKHFLCKNKANLLFRVCALYIYPVNIYIFY